LAAAADRGNRLQTTETGLLGGGDVGAEAFGFVEIDVLDARLVHLGVDVQQDADAAGKATCDIDFRGTQERNLGHANGAGGLGGEGAGQVGGGGEDRRDDLFKLSDVVDLQDRFQQLSGRSMNQAGTIGRDAGCSTNSSDGHGGNLRGER
jgi:hypothetical protein